MAEALCLGSFVHYQAAWQFVRDLETVAERLDKLVSEGEAQRAVPLYETFIGACHEKADEIDDSSGNFGTFVQELFVGWVRARTGAKTDAAETAQSLASWIADDPYGFCHHLEREVTKAMDAAHLTAFAQEASERLHRAAPHDGGPGGYPKRRWTEVFKHILAASGDAAGYLKLCEDKGLSSSDCNVLAEISERSEHYEEALAWVERGLVLARQERYGSSADYELKRRQRQLLVRLGRVDEAVAVAWAEYASNPCKTHYETLMEVVPPQQRQGYRDRAVELAETAALGPAIELFVAMADLARLAHRIATAAVADLQGLSHRVLEPAAELLRTSHPELAARAYRALAVRILDAKKNKLYDVALGYLEHARDCYAAAGQASTWAGFVEEVRAVHRRKYSFMSGFERVVSGLPAAERRPTFVERARKKWNRWASSS